jgi:Protein of unknown function (DUF3048) N-terminal domain/Protein of unknown function (DUF3048) C-terminal domain
LALTRRGRWVWGLGVVVVVAASTVAVLALTGKGGELLRKVPFIGTHLAPPPTCPLTGVERSAGKVPDRPALAIKVENLPEARPQSGLQAADIVYEEPVEGGITRFIAVYQCRDSKRVGPVRSARFTDVGVLAQFGKQTLFGFAGGAPRVKEAVDRSGLNDLRYNIPRAEKAYWRDPNRSAPHNLYTSTRALYRAGGGEGGPPRPVFDYRNDVPTTSRKAKSVHLDWSSTSNVFWTWNAKRGVWLRSYDTGPALLEGNVQIAARNVVVQVSKVVTTNVIDAAGNPSPEVIAKGTGKAYVFRNGRVIVGTWTRGKLADPPVFKDRHGDVIPLASGTTWVELLPKGIPVVVTK